MMLKILFSQLFKGLLSGFLTCFFFVAFCSSIMPIVGNAQQLALFADEADLELTLPEKTLQVLYDISKLNPATELPESYRVALLKISTDFPFAQALGASFNKSAVHSWLQTNPAQLEEIYLLLSAYFNELDSANQPAESQPKTIPARR